MKEIYLAGPWNEYSNNWKDNFKDLNVFDPEIHANQTSPDKYVPEDVQGIIDAEYMIAYPHKIPAEAMWFEAGLFYATHTKEMGKVCEDLIIVWPEDRQPDWALPFLSELGVVVNNFSEAKEHLNERK